MFDRSWPGAFDRWQNLTGHIAYLDPLFDDDDGSFRTFQRQFVAAGFDSSYALVYARRVNNSRVYESLVRGVRDSVRCILADCQSATQSVVQWIKADGHATSLSRPANPSASLDSKPTVSEVQDIGTAW